MLRDDRAALSRPSSLSVEPANELRHRYFEGVADSKQGQHRNWSPCFDLLPVTCRETESNHVFLSEASSLSQASNPASQSMKEPLLIRHGLVCRVGRAKTPRAD